MTIDWLLIAALLTAAIFGVVIGHVFRNAAVGVESLLRDELIAIEIDRGEWR